MRVPVCIVKIGGSLLGERERLRGVLAGLAEGDEGPAIIVPGGGPFAEAVRTTQTALGFDDTLAHRLALDAMGRTAEVMATLEPRLSIVRDIDVLGETRTSSIWDPVCLRAGHPGIPESWDVTSDSLALWLATTLRARRCILLKSAPCPTGARPVELARLGLVDRAFPAFARKFGGEIVLRGPNDRAASLADRPVRSLSRARSPVDTDGSAASWPSINVDETPQPPDRDRSAGAGAAISERMIDTGCFGPSGGWA